METYTFEEIKSVTHGERGTPDREVLENQLQMSVISEKLKAKRLKNNMTQEELGRLIGVNKTCISRIENGRANITIDLLRRVAIALGVVINLDIQTT